MCDFVICAVVCIRKTQGLYIWNIVDPKITIFLHFFILFLSWIEQSEFNSNTLCVYYMHEGWLKYIFFYLFKKFYCVNMNNCFHFLVCLLSIDSGKTVRRFIKKSSRKNNFKFYLFIFNAFFFGPDLAKIHIINPISYLNEKVQSIIWLGDNLPYLYHTCIYT